jgi:hypothetical protein
MVEATRALVVRKIRQVFPGRAAGEVLAVLDRYGAEGHHRARERVQLAILKLCDESTPANLEDYVATACADCRDVLAWAESPNLMARPAGADPAERAALVARDRAQYLAWLDRR